MIKRRTHGIALILFSIFLFCAGPSIPNAKQTDSIHITSEADKHTVLAWGFKFASAMPVKPHIVDRSKSQYQVLKVYIEENMTDKAVENIDHIADWHRCLSYADLAVYFAARDRDTEMQSYLIRARECRDTLQGWKTSWQKDRVLLRMAEAHVLSDQVEVAEKTETELPAEIAGLARVQRLRHFSGHEEYQKSIEQLQVMESSEHMEVQREIARSYITILKQLGREVSTEQFSTLQKRIYGITKKLPQLVQHEILCSLGRTAFVAGQPEIGRQVLEDTEAKLKSHDLKVRYDVPSLSVLAQIWNVEAGDKKRAKLLMREAENQLQNSSIKGADKVKVLIAMAQGYGVFGDTDKAWDSYRQALETAGNEKNARPRAKAITSICAAIGNWREKLPYDLAREMKRLYAALGAPW